MCNYTWLTVIAVSHLLYGGCADLQKFLWNPVKAAVFSFVLGPQDFSFINEDMQPEAEPGDFIVFISDQEVRITLV